MRDYRMPNMGGSTIAKRLTVKLLDELRNGIFKEAVRLPSEVELAEHFGVSRSVIRDVLADLEGEGYVERGRGVGTVVNRQIVNLPSRMDMKFEYNDLIRVSGCVPSTDAVRLYQKPADEFLADKLGVDAGEPLIVCEKRVNASGTPVIYSIDHLPEALFERLDWRTLDWAAPVFDLLLDHCGIDVDSFISRLAATPGPAGVRDKLHVAENEALILLDEVGYYKLNRPILHSLGFYTNYFDFSLLRRNF